MIKKLQKPAKLRPGDTIAVITLSWGGAGALPYRYEIGKKRLEDIFGLKVVETKHALKDPDWIYNNPKARADDLMEAFADKSIKGIFAMIGGDESIRLLPYIDYSIIKKNPKIFMGYSDSTVTHLMCYKAGLSSFYGPCIMVDFAENIEMFPYCIQSIRQVLFGNTQSKEILPNKDGWTTEFLDWFNPDNQQIKRQLQPAKPWQYIQGKGSVQGHLLGGCLDSFLHINGTSLWPTLDQWQNAVLFIETSERGMEIDRFMDHLRNLGAQGVLAVLKAILFGRPGGPINPDQFVLYDQAFIKVCKEFGRSDLSIVTHMDFGHTDPKFILPYGLQVEIDCDQKRVVFLEKSVL
ncbi:MAG: LD-carboxypeptidase [Alphaproteobacteria bacterium]|nr:LD-carboxypeptidase [Alphaproteobacteria bacterium]